jgi:hypothetical protein
MCVDALERNESCGGHFREEYQTPDGEAQRDDEHFSYVAAWGYRGYGNPEELVERAARVQLRAPEPEELQVDETDSEGLAADVPSKRVGQICQLSGGRANPDMSMLECLDVLNEN